jgi:hypothetical protein
LRIHPRAHNPNTRAPDTAPSLVVQEKIILVLESIALRTMKTLLRKDPNRKNKKAGKNSPDEQATYGDPEDSNYLPLSEDPRQRRFHRA